MADAASSAMARETCESAEVAARILRSRQAIADIEAARNPKEGLEDLLWTLLNTREFQFNH